MLKGFSSSKSHPRTLYIGGSQTGMPFVACGDLHGPVSSLCFITDRPDSGLTRELAIAVETVRLCVQ